MKKQVRQFFNDQSELPAVKTANRMARAHADALALHERMEAELARALNRWMKSRAAVKRTAKRTEKLFNDLNKGNAP